MLRPALQNLLIGLYGIVRRTSFLSTPLGRRAYQWAYDIYKRRLEAQTVTHLRRWVPAGACVIDVGANVGFFTRQFADWVGPAGQVIAIEPERRNVAMLTTALERDGHLSRVEVVEAAAGDVDGTLQLAITPDHPGDHRIGTQGETVTAVTLDGLAVTRGLAGISLLKIDVQGYEGHVLRGAKELLRTQRPAVFLEIDPSALAEQGGSAAATLQLLSNLGYAPYLLTEGGELQAAAGVAEHAEQTNGYLDVLALPADGGPVASAPTC